MINDLELPLVQTFSGIAFTQAILLQHGRTKNEIYNNYINLFIDKLEYEDNPELNFPGILAEDYRLRKVFWGDLYRDETGKLDFIPLVKRLIRQGKYIYVYDFDDFYAPYSHLFLKKHMAHDVYIYGYDRENFYVMAYSGGKLRKMIVNQKWIEKGYLRKGGMPIPAHISTMKLSVKRRIGVSEVRIAENLKCYLEGKAQNYPTRSQEAIERKAYGITVYNELDTYLKKAEERKEEIDIRIFRLLWEHKMLMLLRIKKLEQKHRSLKQQTLEYVPIEKRTEIVFRMAIKYSLCEKTEILSRMRQELQQISRDERIILRKVLLEI